MVSNTLSRPMPKPTLKKEGPFYSNVFHELREARFCAALIRYVCNQFVEDAMNQCANLSNLQ